MKRGKNITVLLNGWGGFAGTSLIDCLKQNYEGRKVRVFCTDIKENPILQHKADGFAILPRGDSPRYLDALIRLCRREKIDVVIPGSNPEILTIARNRDLLASNDIHPAVSDSEMLEQVMDKGQTYEILAESGIPVPDFYHVKTRKEFLHAIRKLGYPRNPVCFKPSSYQSSGGARGFRILRKGNSLQKIILESKPGSAEIDHDTAMRLVETSKDLDLLVMEYLPGNEFSVYVLADRGEMLYCVANLRERIEQFYSFQAVTVDDRQVTSTCRRIVGALGLSYNVNIQLKMSSKRIPKVVEINPRMGGSIVLPSAAGVNLPYLAVKQALGEDLPRTLRPRKTRMIRYWKEMFETNSKAFEYYRKPKT
ncbi:MAG TPA: ATP-grasp domain-containing protein [Candidatus Nitrosotalea sp.]|nr:ATP-grasp domain-containing protein [Candidatus Nitrosotalea sp.]